jgi:hypothetical protein
MLLTAAGSLPYWRTPEYAALEEPTP